MLKFLDIAIGFAVVMLGASLVLTTLTQALSALLSLRGSNLRWGLQTLFEQIDPKGLPELSKNGRLVAEKILTHCLVSDSVLSAFRNNRATRRFQLANAIRPSELTAILVEFATNPARFGITAELAADIAKLVEQSGTFQATAASMERSAIAEAGSATGKFETWFTAMMDRVSQRFTTKARIATMILAALLAFTIDLDSIRLARSLATNDSLREGVVAAMEPILAAGGAAAADTGGAPGRAGTAIHFEALRRTASDKGITAPVPQNVSTQAEAEGWLAANVPDPATRAAVIAAYRGRLREVAGEFSRRMVSRVAEIRQTLGAAGLEILPPATRTWPWEDWTHFLGLLISCVLLSLGAPFWFNSLTAMSNLRPVLANKEKQERQQSTGADA